MPCLRIATGLWAQGIEMKLLEAVQAALVSACRIPESARDVILDLYDDTRRIYSTGRTERYTRIEIIGIAARSAGAKRELFRSIGDNLEALGMQRDHTRIYLLEPPADSWSVMGGELASEVDLGFQIDI